MKLSTLIPTISILITGHQTLACVHSRGLITHDQIMGWGISWDFDDNGVQPCPGPSKLDKDGGYIITCKPGYSLKFSQTGTQADYSHNGQNFHWTQRVKQSKSDGIGACDDKKGWCTHVTNWEWDTKNYNCK